MLFEPGTATVQSTGAPKTSMSRAMTITYPV
jgi:hypothetical protein